MNDITIVLFNLLIAIIYFNKNSTYSIFNKNLVKTILLLNIFLKLLKNDEYYITMRFLVYVFYLLKYL